MPNLGGNEKIIIALLFGGILIGSGAHYYKIKRLDIERPFPIIREEISPSKIININEAQEEDLTLLKGIGFELANRIIAYRNSNGPFRAKEEIMKVKGIGPKKYEKIKDLIAAN